MISNGKNNHRTCRRTFHELKMRNEFINCSFSIWNPVCNSTVLRNTLQKALLDFHGAQKHRKKLRQTWYTCEHLVSSTLEKLSIISNLRNEPHFRHAPIFLLQGNVTADVFVSFTIRSRGIHFFCQHHSGKRTVVVSFAQSTLSFCRRS